MRYTLSNFYTSDAWKKFRRVVINDRLTKEGYTIDEVTGNPILQAYDIILHHKTPLTEFNVNDPDIALNPDNIMIVSHKTHNIIHSRFGYENRKVYLVYGSPCAGKTTWVLDVASPEDLILDIDRLWSAVCVDGMGKPDRLKSNVFGLRDCLLDQIKTRRGKWRNAYIVGGYPLIMERRRLCDLVSAEPLYIDCAKDVCLLRAKEKGHGWEKFVENWWGMYQPEPQA